MTNLFQNRLISDECLIKIWSLTLWTTLYTCIILQDGLLHDAVKGVGKYRSRRSRSRERSSWRWRWRSDADRWCSTFYRQRGQLVVRDTACCPRQWTQNLLQRFLLFSLTTKRPSPRTDQPRDSDPPKIFVLRYKSVPVVSQVKTLNTDILYGITHLCDVFLHPDPMWSDGALSFFCRLSPQQQQGE